MSPGLDVVVVNYRTPEDLYDFCYSLEQFPFDGPFTLTVVNVSPTPRDVAVGEWALDSLGATHLCFADNIGYARACNAGAAKGKADYLALFNADVRLSKDALGQCCDALSSNPRWAVLGPRQVDDDGRITHAGIFGTHTAPVHRAWKQLDCPEFADVQEAVTVSGAAYFVRRAVWDELTTCVSYRSVAPDAEGAFLPTPHFFEETYCSYHAFAHGYMVVYYGPVCIVHRWHKASPLGGWAEQQFPISQDIFRKACDVHSIPHD